MIKLINQIAEDTLKREKNGVRRWSKTALTMFGAWILVSFSYTFHTIFTGFDLAAFSIMVGIATGMKTFDAISKNINKDNTSE